jgi:citrate synthase
MLTSKEAAARLGVKVSTVYVYVSRGLLESHRSEDGRRSLFAVEDVEHLARRGRGGRGVESRMAVVNTAITELRPDGPHYRGRPAVELAADSTPEQVAELLWNTDEPGVWAPAQLGPAPTLAPHDLMLWRVIMAGAADPLRSDLRPRSVVRAARRLITTLAGTGEPVADDTGADEPGSDEPGSDEPVRGLSHRMAVSLCGPSPDPGLVEAVRVAMVVLADHELATSTLAVRVAASTRADLYDAMLAGLGTLAGPLHGSAARHVVALLRAAIDRGAPAALDEAFRDQGLVLGFGHGAYPQGDPRCTALLAAVRALGPSDAMDAVDAVLGLAGEAELPPPNIDLAVGALAVCAEIDPAAIGSLFAVARCSGWVAHYLEELDELPLRFRARAVHVTSR